MAPEQKVEWLKMFKAWKESPISEELLEWLSESIERDAMEEDNSLLTSEYETIQSYAWHKGHRVAIRKVIKQIEKDK